MKRFVMMVSAGVAAMMLSGSVLAAGPDAVTPAQIAAAKTAADHEAIAKAYDDEANRLEAMAKEHEQMAQSYRAMTTGSKGADPAAMAAHCTKLVKEYQAAAKQNKDLAAAHRQMAKDCCKSK